MPESKKPISPYYDATGPTYDPTEPGHEPIESAYDPTYKHSSPPIYTPSDCPDYEPTSPAYEPTSPSYEMRHPDWRYHMKYAEQQGHKCDAPKPTATKKHYGIALLPADMPTAARTWATLSTSSWATVCF